jgi:molybdopterin converting factor small subunit
MIDGQISREGPSAEIKPDSEVHFIPAIGGGQASVVRCP